MDRTHRFEPRAERRRRLILGVCDELARGGGAESSIRERSARTSSARERAARRKNSTDGFDCGQPTLDRLVRAYAGQAQRRDVARTFVTADSEL
jgi:hypothetical protein